MNRYTKRKNLNDWSNIMRHKLVLPSHVFIANWPITYFNKMRQIGQCSRGKLSMLRKKLNAGMITWMCWTWFIIAIMNVNWEFWKESFKLYTNFKFANFLLVCFKDFLRIHYIVIIYLLHVWDACNICNLLCSS